MDIRRGSLQDYTMHVNYNLDRIAISTSLFPLYVMYSLKFTPFDLDIWSIVYIFSVNDKTLKGLTMIFAGQENIFIIVF